MKKKQSLRAHKKAKKTAIILGIYADCLLLIPLLLSLLFGLDTPKNTCYYIVALAIVGVVVFIMVYKMVLFLHKYHENNGSIWP